MRRAWLAAAAAVAVGVCIAQPATAEAGGLRFRVEVSDPETGEEIMQMLVPLASVDEMLRDAGVDLDRTLAEAGRGIDWRPFYRALRDQPVADLLEVQEDTGDRVKLWKDPEALHLEAWEDGAPRLRAKVPLLVLDVLLDVPPEADGRVEDAIRTLMGMAPLTLAEVFEEDRQIRIVLE